ncbi:MAG: TonB-dependent receptor [Gammaproteobacteria bacterium]|nr:TonB-dependent receptor [Gammaproteobacteria bacterium]
MSHLRSKRVNELFVKSFLHLAMATVITTAPLISANEQTDTAAKMSTEISQDLLFDDLLHELEQVTEIATHTRLNVDYVPGMVTVLHGPDLLRRGIHSFIEALQTVPGVEISVSDEGQSSYIMRGIGKSFSSGKIKMLVNGRAMNAALSAASTISTIPVQLIERIEVIRGPGSAIYGEYAFAGVVNVITRKDTHLFYGGTNSNKHILGATWSNQATNESLKYALSMSAHDNAGKQVKVGADYLKTSADPLFQNISNSPGYSNEAEQIYTSILQLSYKDFQWDSSLVYQKVGDYFGYQNALPPKVEPLRKIVTASSDIDRRFKFTESLSGVASAGGRFYSLRGALHHFLPDNFPDFTTLDTGTGGVSNTFENGVLGTPNYTEYEAHGNIEFEYSGINSHDFLFGFHAAIIKQGNTWARRNQESIFVAGLGNVIREIPLANYRGEDNWLTENNVRKIASLYAQDQWAVSKPLTLTVGGRYDNYLDAGNSFNPRIAAVYNFLDNHIFKAQLSRAFRPPTFFELYVRNNLTAEGNPDILPETIQTAEMGYIYNRINTIFRLTAFYSEMNDLISNDEISGKFENLDSVTSRGIEIELSKKIFDSLSISANGTFLRTKDKSTDNELPNIANITANSSITYETGNHITFVISDQYIGSRKRETGDTRKSLASYHVLNSTINLSNIFVKQISLVVGIKNLLNTRVLHPSPLVSLGGISVPSYEGDYPRAGREFWLNIEYKY